MLESVKRYDIFILIFLLLLYSIFIKSSQFSRWLPLIFVGLSVSIFMLFESRKKYFVCLVSLLVSLFFFMIVLKGRGGFEQGFYGFLLQVDGFSIVDDSSQLSKLLANVFGGYIVLAESLDIGWFYEPGYILRAFSPFPSFIDGWDAYHQDVGRINSFVPFNSLAEIYFFGWWLVVLSSVFFFCSILRIEYLSRRYASTFTVAAFVVFIYVFLAAFFYPLRNIFRVYLICIVLYEVSALVIKSRDKKKNIKSNYLVTNNGVR